MAEVMAGLSWLLEAKTPADLPESYYFLGKALASAGKYRGADRAMTLFIAAVKAREMNSPLLADAYYISAYTKASAGDRKGALAVYRAGLEIAEAGMRD
jgi:hypothetical protein